MLDRTIFVNEQEFMNFRIATFLGKQPNANYDKCR